MNSVEVVAVVGACAPERTALARRLAAHGRRTLVTATRLASHDDPIEAAVSLTAHPAARAGTVLEFPSETSVTDVIGALADPDGPTRLMGVICVVDASHLLSDLRNDEYVSRASAGHPDMTEHTARALLTVMQVEFASAVILVNWESLATPELSTSMALVSHLNPRARLRLDRAGADVMPLRHALGLEQTGAGWMRMLNGEFDPHMTDPRVSAVRYEQARPLHPERLQRFLDERLERGEFGSVIRSSGFCRLATRPGITARWDHVGRMISLAPISRDDQLGADDEPLALGQDLVLIGLDLRADDLIAAMDDATLTDEELLSGPDVWMTFVDPFPIWPTQGHGTRARPGHVDDAD